MLGQSGWFFWSLSSTALQYRIVHFFVARRPGKAAQHMGLASFSGASKGLVNRGQTGDLRYGYGIGILELYTLVACAFLLSK